MSHIDHNRRAAYLRRWQSKKNLLWLDPAEHPGLRALFRSLEAAERHAVPDVLDHIEGFSSEYGLVLMTSPYLHPGSAREELVAEVKRMAAETGTVWAVGNPGEGPYARRADTAYASGRRFAPSYLDTNVCIVFILPFAECATKARGLARRIVKDVVPLESEMRPDRDELKAAS